MTTPDKQPPAAHPPGWDKLAVPDGTSAIMTPAMAKAVAAAPRKVDDEPLVAAPALTELADAASQSLRNLDSLRGELQGMRATDAQQGTAAALARLDAALQALEFPSAKTGGWWPLGRGKEKEALTQAQDRCEAVGEDLKSALAAFKALGQQVRERAARASRVRTQLEVESHALDQVVDKGRRKAGGVVEALKRQAALAVEDGEKLRRIEEVRALTDQFSARIEPMARVAAAAGRVTALLKGATVIADFERREAKLNAAASEWRQCVSQLDSADRIEAAKEATEALHVETGKATRVVQAMNVAQKELDSAADELAQVLVGAT